VIDTGKGPPIVLIPGIQGRWEWLTPTIEALAQRHRVLSFSLGEWSGRRSAGNPFDAWVSGIDCVLDRAREQQAVIVGVSFGGLIAARYAAQRPDRTGALVLVSTPSPRMKLDRVRSRYLSYPRLMAPAFVVRSCRRLGPELFRARPTWPLRIRLTAEYARRAISAPVSTSEMSRWVRAWQDTDIEADCARVIAPTLVITGEPGLDRVVPVETTREYLRLIPGARHETLPDTGHVGLVLKPDRFAELVDTFLNAA
jgi:pimeloyl-ACP methyl ester carboxylesterase